MATATVTVPPFRMPAAAERPASLCFPAYSVAAVRPSILTLSPFSFSYAHGRYALTGRFLYRAYLVDLVSCDYGLLRVTCHRFAYPFLLYAVTVSRLCLPFVLAGLRHAYVTRTLSS